MPKSELPRDYSRKPGYPGSVDQGSSTPEGYQKEARGHKPSGKGTPLSLPKTKVTGKPAPGKYGKGKM